jgi:large subunit ribosomal protein L29
MKMRELVELDDQELAKRLRDLQEEAFNLRFQYATRQLTNHSRMREVRRDIARVRTLMRQRELVEMGA